MDPVIVLADRGFSVADVRIEGVLDVRNIDAKAWAELTRYCVAGELRLYHLLIRSLDGIDNLHNTLALELMWANKISDLAPLFRMSWLARLRLSDLPLLRSIDGIEPLSNLKELDLSGNCGSLHPPLRLASLKPIAKLKKLTKLSIFNVRLEDNDISFLGSAFPNLRSLDVWNTNVDFEQFASIASKLNGQLETPITPGQRLNVSCSKCGGPFYRFLGYRMPTVCEHCDESRFRKLVARFNHPSASL